MPAQHPVRFYADDPRFLGAFVSELKQEREATVAQVCGQGVPDWETYRRLIGKIEGIDFALGICAEAQKET